MVCFLCVVKLAVACLLGLKGTPSFAGDSLHDLFSQSFLFIGGEISREVLKLRWLHHHHHHLQEKRCTRGLR